MSQFGGIKIGASMYFYFMSSQAFWHSSIHKKPYVLCVNLVIGAIIAAKILI
jgi:hypothetical protein